MIVFNIIGVLFAAAITLKTLKRSISIVTFGILIFDAAYVFPMAVEIFLGPANIGYYGFRLALNDTLATFIYLVFTIFTLSVFYYYIKRNTTKNKKIKDTLSLLSQLRIIRKNLGNNNGIVILSFALTLIPFFVLIFAPSPKIYFKIGLISEHKSTLSNAQLNYQENVVRLFNYISFFGVILYKLCDTKNLFYRKIIRGLSIAVITLLDGKRTFFAFLMILLWMIDITSSKKKDRKILDSIITMLIIALYFFYYANVSGKIHYSNTIYSMISEYFFRSNSVKVSIYCVLHPDEIKILDYPFQTLIYDALFFIPRTAWASKPYAFPDYYSSAVNGFKTLTDIGWKFQTDIYSEFIANMGLIGIIVSPLFLIWLALKSERTTNVIAKFLGAALMVLLQVFEYNDAFKVIMILWIILYAHNYFHSKYKIKFYK